MAKQAPTKPAKTTGKGKRAPKKAEKKGTAPAKKATAKRAENKAERKPQEQHAASREDVFVTEYLVDLNGRQAAIRAGYSPQSARQTASELLATPRVQEKVQAAMDARAERTGITADAVLKRLNAIANADPAALIELHRGACRYCWGKDNRYQWTAGELREAIAEFKRDQLLLSEEKAKQLTAPDAAGGTGYNPYADPNPSCPECFGRGIERVMPNDTRDVPPEARLLYAGVKTTQHGLEIKMHDQMAALRDVGRHLGMFKDKVELTGKDGGPVKHQDVGSLLDEIDGAGTGLPAHGAARG